MSMFTKAERSKRKARIAIFGPSGGGKTYTALAIASGLGGTVALVDTERSSASLYAGTFEFDTCNLPSHDIGAYTLAIDDAAKAGYGVLIIDSLSHAWKEMLAEVDKISANSKSGNSFNAWSKVSPKQKLLVQAILNYPGHIIATMRSDTAWAIEQNDRGKQVPVRLGLKPEQGKGIEFEFDMLISMDKDNVGTFEKDRTGLFHGRQIDKPGEQVGKDIAAWLEKGVDAPEPVSTINTGTDWLSDEVFKNAAWAASGKSMERLTEHCKKFAINDPANLTKQITDEQSRAAFVAELKGS